MRRGHETAITMEFDMWAMPTFELLRLSELRSHEDLRAEGKIVRVDDSMRNIFYVSHEWTSMRHPDPSLSQLHTLQTLLLRMLRGELPESSPTFADAIRLPKNVKITTAQWQSLVQDSFIWMDFISLPQKTSDESLDSDYEKASRSIAAYIERASHFLVVCPTVRLTFTACPVYMWSILWASR